MVGRRDFRCQACGAGFTLLPKAGLRVLVGLALYGNFFLIGCLLFLVSLASLASDPAVAGGVLVGAMIVGSLAAAGLVHATSSYRHQRANPVVPNAPRPMMRFQEVSVPRRCRCGAAAPLIKTVTNTTNWVPTGTDYTYHCAACGASFRISNVWGLVFLVLAGSVMAPLSYLFFVYPPGGYDVLDWENLICLSTFLLATLFAGSAACWGAAKRWALHPPTLPPAG